MSQTTNLSIILFTGNQNKVKEINHMLTNFPIPINSYTEVFESFPEVIEDGNTFVENAIKKVSATTPSNDVIYIAEDSGIEVEALDGRPGIFSARYAGKDASREDMCNKLLTELGNDTNRNAQYQAAIAIRFPDNTIQTVSGIVKGTLAQSMRGKEGFGYDPIFIPNGYEKTFGELPKELKNTISHRFNAIQKMKETINKYLESNT